MKVTLTKVGPILIACGAALWAMDGLFRFELLATFPRMAIVFFEHTIGALFLAPFLVRGIEQYKKLAYQEWLVVLMMSLVSSVLGAYLFTSALAEAQMSFDYLSPTLMQQTQPLIVIALSVVIFKDKVDLKFLGLTAVALIATYMINFGTTPITIVPAEKIKVYLLAIGAAAAWGSGTIMSKSLLNKLGFMEAVALRFALAIPISAVFMMLLGQNVNPLSQNFEVYSRLVAIAAITGGVVAISLYYLGLKNTPAKVATLAELSFPVTSLIIAISRFNPYGAAQPLNLANIFGVVILVIMVFIVVKDYSADKVSSA